MPSIYTYEYPLNLVGWQGSQDTEHAQALVGTVNTASLNSLADQTIALPIWKACGANYYDQS